MGKSEVEGDEMKRALFMTVGTGVGLDKEKKVKNLAHGLLTSIEHYNPDIIVFFGSEESKETIESLKAQYHDKKGRDLRNYEFVRLDDIDDFYECYVKMEEEIKRKEGDYEIIIDYTSGTKTMTTSAAICAMLYQKKLSLIEGKRGKDGIVMRGTEAPKEQSLFAAYDKFLLDKAKEAFNSYRFGEAMGYIDKIVALEEKETYRKIVQAYDLWDKFEHASAYEILREIRREFRANKEFLAKLIKAGREKPSPYIIVDILNNAKRRIEEGKYDDAVARLYRTVELIAQYILREKYDIDSSNVDIWHLQALGMEGKIREKYEGLRDEKGKIKLSLKRDYELLKDLGDEMGKRFFEDNLMQELLSKRNNSILAHGLEPVSREDAEKMFEVVRGYVEEVVPDARILMEKSAFPKL